MSNRKKDAAVCNSRFFSEYWHFHQHQHRYEELKSGKKIYTAYFNKYRKIDRWMGKVIARYMPYKRGTPLDATQVYCC